MINLMPVETFDNIVINAAGKPWAVFQLLAPSGMASYRFHSDSAMINYAAQTMTWIRGLPLESRLLSVARPISSTELGEAVASAPHLIQSVSSERHEALQAQADEAADRIVDLPAHSVKPNDLRHFHDHF